MLEKERTSRDGVKSGEQWTQIRRIERRTGARLRKFLTSGERAPHIISLKNFRLAMISGSYMLYLLLFSKKSSPTPIPLLSVRCGGSITVVFLLLWSLNQKDLNPALTWTMKS